MKKIYFFLLGIVALTLASCNESADMTVTNKSRYYAIIYIDDVQKAELNAGRTTEVTIKKANKKHDVTVTLHEYKDDTHYYTTPTKTYETSERFKWTYDYELVITNTSVTLRESDI